MGRAILRSAKKPDISVRYDSPVTCFVQSVGVAAGRWRLPTSDVNQAWGRGGGRGQSAVCGPDEDSLTLAWQAADRALDAAGLSPESVEAMWWGTARPPFAEGPSWTQLAAVLRLAPTTNGFVVSGSSHSGIDAFIAALDALESGRLDNALVIASDAVSPAVGGAFEAIAGAGAVALVLSRTGGAAHVTGAGSTWAPVLDRYRGDSEDETRESYDGRLFREQIFLPMMAEAAAGSDATRWSIPDPDGRLAAIVIKQLSPAGATAALISGAARTELGDTGAAAPWLGAAATLGEPGSLAVMAYGAGRATRFDIEVTSPVPGADRVAADLAISNTATYVQVLRARKRLTTTGESVEMAVPPGSAMFVRGNRETLGLLGARCVDCATINIPPSIHPACVSCGGTKFDEVQLARTGSVQTFVINHTMPQPFEAPLPLIVVDLDDGSRIQLQGATDGSDIAIDARVELILRRYTVERGVPIYGWKVQPISTAQPIEGVSS